jgi:tripartite-type tricarboxylate transporter receptor subunit TctC
MVFRILLVLALLAPPLAAAQDSYPSKPLRLVVPFPPGGLTDVLGRAMADRLGSALGQPVVVENRPGAGTLLGAEVVAKAPADGYTLLLATSTTFGIAPALYKTATIDVMRDFQPVSLIGAVNFFLVGSPSVPAKSLEDLVRLVKASPGKYNYASVGNGTAHHLFMEDLKQRLGLDIQHVPYKGTPAAMVDVMPGKVHFMFSDAAVAVPLIQAGKVVAYGTSAAKQNSLIASVPPMAQTVPGFDWQAWQGISVAAGTPPAVVHRLWMEMQKFQAGAEFHGFLSKIGMEPAAPTTSAAFAAMVKEQLPRWAGAVRNAGVKID